MKKICNSIKTLAALLVVGVAFTACSNSDSDNIIEQPKKPGIKSYKLSIEASKNDMNALTRAILTEKNGNLIATWNNDNVTPYMGTNKFGSGSFVNVYPMDNGKWAKLEGYLNGYSISENDVITLKIEPNDYYNQKGSLSEIAKEKYKAEASIEVKSVVYNASAGEYSEIKTTGPAKFQSKQAIVKFTIEDKNSSNPTPSGFLSMVVTAGEQTYTFAKNNISWDEGQPDNVFYVAMDAIADKTVTVQVNANSGNYTYTKEHVTFENGKYYPITVKMTKQ